VVHFHALSSVVVHIEHFFLAHTPSKQADLASKRVLAGQSSAASNYKHDQHPTEVCGDIESSAVMVGSNAS
jgi:hypothetical protein